MALLILGAIYVGISVQRPGSETDTSRRALETAAEDGLIVLAGMREPRGNLLDLMIAEAFDCAMGENPSPTGCSGTRPSNLSLRLDGYLPQGAAHAIAIDNGLNSRTLYATSTPSGERVSTARAFTPDWNLTFVAVDLSCHASDMDVNVTLVPIWHAQLAEPTSARATAGAAVATAAETHTTGLWNATLPPTAIGQPVRADIEAPRAHYDGTASTHACALGTSGWAARGALNQSAATVAGPDAAPLIPLGKTLTVHYDFTPFAAIPGATLERIEAIVYAPVTARPHAEDAFVIAHTLDAGTTWSGEATWTVPRESLFGIHPIVVQAHVTLPGDLGDVALEARLVTLATFALPNGLVPFDPPYRAILETWQPDWR